MCSVRNRSGKSFENSQKVHDFKGLLIRKNEDCREICGSPSHRFFQALIDRAAYSAQVGSASDDLLP
jgi:hypothetical protein